MDFDINQGKGERFAAILLEWFKINAREFPWRRESDPYKILVSEILLQKTQARNVVPVYDNFISRYPNINFLSLASFRGIKREILSLGLSTQRAKNLEALGKFLDSRYEGKIPTHREELLQLPGVGTYIANAVLCFAFNADFPLLDTNIGRIIQRVFSIEVSGEERKKAKSWNTIASLIPEGKARDFNYSLIDFGALVCKAKNPKHHLCPLYEICDYFSDFDEKD